MRTRAAAVFALAATVLGACGESPLTAGTDAGPGTPHCADLQVTACACTDGTHGVQTCFSGRWGRCSCDTTACAPAGEVEPCKCADGRVGGKVCLQGGAFGACACAEPPDAGAWPGPDASMPRRDGGTAPRDAGYVTQGAYYGSSEKIVDYFPSEGGLLVVRARGIELLADDGASLKTVDSLRDITSAAFDGKRLAVADKAILTVYDPQLKTLASGYLNESCASSVIIGEEFICGPATTWDRNFGTYELADGSLRATSGNYTYEGTVMIRIPGHPHFFTVDSSTYIYAVGANGAVERYGTGGWGSSSSVQQVGAFDGNPASRWIDRSGHIYRIYGSGCGSSNGSGCFVQDGELGTSTAGAVVAMADDGAGRVFNVVGSRDYWSQEPCDPGCTLQRVDVGARLVEKEVPFSHSTASSVTGAKWDPFRRRLIVGVQIGGSSWEPATAFELWRFDLD